MIFLFLKDLFFNKKCPFCRSPTTRKAAASSNHTDLFFCAVCDTNFIEEYEDDSDPSLEPFYPPSIHIAAGPQRSTHFHPLLCQPCNNHQSIIIQLLAAYEEDTRANKVTNFEEELKRYRTELDRRYPLCAACKVAVGERIKQLDFRLRTNLVQKKSSSTSIPRRKSRRLDFRCLINLLFIGSIPLLQKAPSLVSFTLHINIAFTVVLILFLSITRFGNLLPSLLTLPLIWFPIEYNRYKSYYISGLVVISLINFFLSNRSKRRLRVEKATNFNRPNDLLSSLNLQEENTPLRNNNNAERNPFYSKSLFIPTNNSDVKSFPNSPLYSSKFHTSGIKPTTLGFRGQSTGLEGDFLANVSLNESAKVNNTHSEAFSPNFYSFALGVILKVLFILGRFLLAWESIPLQAVMFAANFALSNQSLITKKHIILLYLFRSICLARLIWLGTECSNFTGKDLLAPIEEKINILLVKGVISDAFERFVQFKNHSSFALDSLIILINN